MKKKALKLELRDVLEAMNARFNLLSFQLKQQDDKINAIYSRTQFLKNEIEELRADQTDIQEGIFEIASDLARVR